MPSTADVYRHFRLNLEQQKKRAKELLAAARAGEPAALARIDLAGSEAANAAGPQPAELKLAAAQRAIAQELRFDSWAALKHHIARMTAERERVAAVRNSSLPAAPDAELRTLHVRCGSDIRATLRQAGFDGDFYEHSYPYLIGPVREGEGCLEQRARFITESYEGDGVALDYARVLADLELAERKLRDSTDYERVVIWSECDCYDQLVLVRLLGHYATSRRLPRIELINVGEFPGAVRFVGIGQLPPEALRVLWPTRKRAGSGELALGVDAWRALANSDPRPLAAIARTGTPALPLLAPALLRHLRELPALSNGLSLTQLLALGLVAQQEQSLADVFAELTRSVDPLPGQGDLQFRDRVLPLTGTAVPLLTRRPGVDAAGRSRPPWTDVLSITVAGRAALQGDLDWLASVPPPRWVGGVAIGVGNPDWRWDESVQDAVLLRPLRPPRARRS